LPGRIALKDPRYLLRLNATFLWVCEFDFRIRRLLSGPREMLKPSPLRVYRAMRFREPLLTCLSGYKLLLLDPVGGIGKIGKPKLDTRIAAP